MACPNMSIEQQFLEALPLTNTFVVENNTLILKSVNDTVLAKFESTNL
jgi:heat shock protein HslJ